MDSASDTDNGDGNTDAADDLDGSDDEISMNTNRNGDSGDNVDLDDTIEMGVNLPVASLDPQTLENLQREIRFSSGSDDLGNERITKSNAINIHLCFTIRCG